MAKAKGSNEQQPIRLSKKQEKFFSQLAYWRYSAVEKIYDGYRYFEVHEVWCDKNDKVILVTEKPEYLGGDNVKDILGDISLIVKDLKKYKPLSYKEHQRILAHGKDREANS